MGIVTDLGPMDLAVEGTAAALALLIAPDDVAAQEDIAAQSLAALRRAAANPLDMRRLMMTARLAEVQALLLTLRTFRAAQDARSGNDGDADQEDWLRAAERSLEAMVHGDVFLATNPVGLTSSWLDLGGGRESADVPPHGIADYRRRAELVAITDLELVLAPEPIPHRLLHHLACPACAPDGGWFAAFGVFIGWQLRKKPHLLEAMMGINLSRPGRQATQRLEAAFQMARQFAFGMERRLALTDISLDLAAAAPVSEACTATGEGGSDDAMVGALSFAFDAPRAALAAVVDRLKRSRILPVRRGCVVRQHAMILAAVHGRWRRPEWSAFAPAHGALCDGRLDEAAHWGRTHIADTASGLSERGDLEVLRGRYLEASDLYGRALEATEATDATDQRGQMSLQLRLAEAMTFQYLTTGDAKAKPIAAETADAVWQRVQASGIAWARLRAVQNLAEMTVAPAGGDRVPSRKSAIGLLDSVLATLGPGEVSLERVEAEALRIELVAELASIDAAGRQGHYEAAEKDARALAALDLSPLPVWVRERASAAVARGLFRPLWSNPSDATVQQAQDAIEVAISGELAAMDPHLASLLQWRLGEIHIQLAKGTAAKSRNEAGAVWLARAFRDTTLDTVDRIGILQRLRHALVQLAKGRVEEWRLCQALAALNNAEAICPKDAPNWHLGTVLVHRALIWARLRALSKDLDELKSAVADADAAAAIFRQLKSPGNLFTALRTKANALLDAGRDERDADIVGQAEAVYAAIIADRQGLKISHRDLCQTYMSRGDAADLRGVLLVEPASRTAGREAAREAYREALKLAVAHNLPTKGSCEAALKKLEAT